MDRGAFVPIAPIVGAGTTSVARHALTYLRTTQTCRSPALPPRREPLSSDFLARLRRWCDALGRTGDRASTLRVLGGWEWVSCDARAVPHTVCVVLQTEGLRRHVFIDEASARIAEPDVRAAVLSLLNVVPSRETSR